MREAGAYIIAHSMGEGISELFRALGASHVPLCKRGEDLVAEICKAAATVRDEQLIILPATSEALYESVQFARENCERNLHIIPTRSIGEVYAALVEMQSESRAEEQILQAASAIGAITSLEVVAWEQQSAFCRCSALWQGEAVSASGSAEGAALLALEQLICERHRTVTLIVGQSISDSCRVFLTERLMEIYPQMQIIVYIGGQTVSEYYIILR